jgi:putative endonuclease
MYYVYLLLCNDKSIYAGITTDVERRFKEHKNGAGGHYTRSHGAKKILYIEKRATRSKALMREVMIKKLSHREKLALAHSGTGLSLRARAS